VDALAALLAGPRATDVFVVRTSLQPPWGILVEDRAPLCVMAVARGAAWITPAGGDPVRLGAGDVAIARGPDPYVLADPLGAEPIARIDEYDSCVSLDDGRPLRRELARGVRTWGNAEDGRDVILVGTYLVDGDISGRLLAALPPLLVVDSSTWDSPLLAVLEAEMTRDAPGQSAVIDRLVDLVTIAALRAWFAQPGDATPGWYRAASDPVVGPALSLLHDRVAEPWTVASLAHEVGVSRALLARRFTEVVGVPPMAYLADWRIGLAADRLREPGTTVAGVAREVGYGSGFALSAAFKRLRGVSPRSPRSVVAATP
jgi:AraC-like DNA-binding protein